MVKAAREAGNSDVSERLVTDWVSLGLLDQPTRVSRGKGRGPGANYEWPESQRDLFLTLLAKRDEATSRAAMCAIPVGVWMYWGDDWIPLRQVRLALRTWWDRPGRSRWKRSADGARLVIDTIAPAGTPRAFKSEVRELITAALENDVFPREELTQALEQLLVNRSSDGRFGPARSTAAEIVDGMWSMAVATYNYDLITDGMFYEARSRLLPIMLSYINEWPTLSKDPVYGRSYEQPTWSFLINQSCPQLLAGLGLQLIAMNDQKPLGPIPMHHWGRLPNELRTLPVT